MSTLAIWSCVVQSRDVSPTILMVSRCQVCRFQSPHCMLCGVRGQLYISSLMKVAEGSLSCGRQNSPSSIDLSHGLYNSSYYRTSRDQDKYFIDVNAKYKIRLYAHALFLWRVSEWVEFNAPLDTIQVISEADCSGDNRLIFQGLLYDDY